MKSFEPSSFDEKFVITHLASGKVMVNQKYEIHLSDGSVTSGVTDPSGHSSLATSQTINGLKIIMKK